MKARLSGIVMAAAMVLPVQVLACHQLSQNVWMCAGDTPWEQAEWDPYGDGATLLLDDYALSFTEDFPGAEIRDVLTTLEEQFVTYAELTEADGNAPLEVNRQELITLDGVQAYRSLQRDKYDDSQTTSAVMLADVKAARIMLYLDGPPTLAWDRIDTASRDVLALLRASCADVATCAGPDTPLPPVD